MTRAATSGGWSWPSTSISRATSSARPTCSERWSASCRQAISAPERCCCWPRSTSGGPASRRRSASPSRRRARRRSAHSEPAASRSSPCGPARPTCPERPRRPEPRSSCWRTETQTPRCFRWPSARACGPTSSSATASTWRPPSGRWRPSSRHRRRLRSTPGPCSSSGSGCATWTISTARGCDSRRPSGRRARRATSRRSPTSCSTARCSSAGPVTGRRHSSLQTGRTRPSS